MKHAQIQTCYADDPSLVHSFAYLPSFPSELTHSHTFSMLCQH